LENLWYDKRKMQKGDEKKMNQTKPIIEEYEINPCTMMIMPMEYGSKVYSRIIEIDDEYLSPFKPIRDY
jgi:hypothetical protein